MLSFNKWKGACLSLCSNQETNNVYTLGQMEESKRHSYTKYYLKYERHLKYTSNNPCNTSGIATFEIFNEISCHFSCKEWKPSKTDISTLPCKFQNENCLFPSSATITDLQERIKRHFNFSSKKHSCILGTWYFWSTNMSLLEISETQNTHGNHY